MTPYDGAERVSNRSGSQNRQRQIRIIVACTEDEFAAIENRARAAGMSRASFARACMLYSPGPRTRRVPHVNAPVMAQAAVALNRIGNLLNQIAHILNASGAISLASNFTSALDEVRDAARAIRWAAGYGRPESDREGQSA